MNPEEIWQVDANGTIYETNFDELKQWVVEGAVLPTDKIRRGNLRWLEAGKVPLLHGVFNARFAETAPQTQINVTHAAPTENTQINTFANVVPTEQIPVEAPPQNLQTPPTPYNTEVKQPQQTQVHQQTNRQTNVVNNQNVCSVHVADEAKYVCVSCENLFCRACPKAYGGVRICPTCGEMCKSLVEVHQKTQQQTNYQNAITEGFGFGDFTNALAFPFKHPASLLIGGIMFAVFSIGQSALNLGALYVAAGGIIGMMLANMIAFACLSNTIEEFSKGNLTANFMPSFDDFNLWDDVVHPFFLSIGVYIVSYGFLFIVIIGGIYMAFSSISSQNNPLNNLPIASSQTSGASPAAMKSFEELMRKDAEQKAKMAELKGESYPPQTVVNTPPMNQTAPNIKNTYPATDPQDTEQMVADAEKMIGDYRKGQAETMVGPSEETQKMQQQMMYSALMNYGVPFILLAFIALLWAIFYYPAACLVAGYTRNFTAVINPLVGLDTIKRLGFSYVKILAMVILLSVIVGIVFGVIGAVLSPFNLPKLGNIPATLITSFISFYFYIVFAAILGYAVYKCKNLLNN
jgi:hypothetical protein